MKHFALAFLFFACGPKGPQSASLTGVDDTGKDFTVEGGVLTLEIVQGGSGGTTVTIARASNRTATDVTMTLKEPPAGITGSGLIGANQTSSTFTISVDAATPANDYALTILVEGAKTRADVSVSLRVTAPQMMQPAQSIGIATNPTSLSLTQGTSGAQATVQLGRMNYTGLINLSAENVPSGATVTFGSQSTIDSMTTVTVTSALGAAHGMHTITLRAAGIGVTDATTMLTVDIAPSRQIDVYVVDMFNAPASNMKVGVAGTFATTNASGHATLVVTGTALTPYTAVVLSPASFLGITGKVVTIYDGLTSATPTMMASLYVQNSGGLFDISISIDGMLTNGTTPFASQTAAQYANVFMARSAVPVGGGGTRTGGIMSYRYTGSGAWPAAVAHPFGSLADDIETTFFTSSMDTYVDAQLIATAVEMQTRGGTQPACGSGLSCSLQDGNQPLSYPFFGICSMTVQNTDTTRYNISAGGTNPHRCDETPGADGIPGTTLPSTARTLNLTRPSTGVFSTTTKQLILYYAPTQSELEVASDCSSGAGCTGADLGTAITYTVPTMHLSPYYVVEMVRSGTLDQAKVIVPMTTTPLAVTVPQPPSATTPANGASGIGYGEQFSWTPTPGGKVHLLNAQYQSGANVFAVNCYTTQASCTLPTWITSGDATYALPASTMFKWRVKNTDRAASVDAVVAGYQEQFVYFADNRYDAETYTVLESGERTFTSP